MSFNRPPATRDEAAKRVRPELWIEGSQKPRFNLPAFGRVSIALSRRVAKPVLNWTSARTTDSATWMSRNTIGPRLGRMGRVGRALPSRDRLAQGLNGTAALLSAAADVAVPPPVVEVPAYPDLLRALEISENPINRRPRRAAPRLPDPEPEPAAAHRPAAPDDFDAPTLAAVRQLIDEMRSLPPVQQRTETPSGRELLAGAVPLAPPEPRDPSPAEHAAAQVFALAAMALGWGVTLLSLPVGAIKAMLIHLNGEDLRTWS
ncbi:MAG: hypothetical protein ACRC14_20520 [Paracoccaceae bacterium]